jgi:hypothetical protein
VKRPGDGGKVAVMKVHCGGVLWHERGAKEGGVGCGVVRRGRGAFYWCRGGGRRLNGAVVVVAEWWHHSGHFNLE